LSANNLKDLICSKNELTSIDVSTSVDLWRFISSDNELTSIDISNNPKLEHFAINRNYEVESVTLGNISSLKSFIVGRNKITTLDVSKLSELETLWINNNELITIDVSSNPKLKSFLFSSTKIERLDLSNNPNLTTVMGRLNRELKSINLKNGNNEKITTIDFLILNKLETVCLDAINSDLAAEIREDVGNDVTFTQDCSSGTLGVAQNFISDFSVSPMPATEVLTVTSLSKIDKIQIYTNLGQLVLENSKEDNINISSLSSGIYFCKILGHDGKTGVKQIFKR